jgi:hypothetical protein
MGSNRRYFNSLAPNRDVAKPRRSSIVPRAPAFLDLAQGIAQQPLRKRDRALILSLDQKGNSMQAPSRPLPSGDRAGRLPARLGACALGAAVALFAGCDSRTADPYDSAEMEMKSPPAQVTTARHTGPFATGAALNPGAELKPLDLEPVKTIQIDTTHKVMEIAPSVKFSGWTFGDQVPGPTIRARAATESSSP